MRNRAFLLLGLVAAVGCGGDDKKAAVDCPVNMTTGVATPGDLFQCTCDAAGTMTGTQACGADLKLTTCDCGGPCPDATLIGQAYQCTCGPLTGQQTCEATGMLTPCDCTGTGMAAGSGGATVTGGTGTGGTGTGGTMSTGAIGGEGGAGGMMATGGAGGTMADQDGGAGTGGSGSGGQLDACMDAMDCGGGLVCYEFGGFCTESCSMMNDPACDAIAGATYTCGPATFGMNPSGACRIICSGESDTSCPDPLSCMDISGGGMGGPTYRCAR